MSKQPCNRPPDLLLFSLPVGILLSGGIFPLSPKKIRFQVLLRHRLNEEVSPLVKTRTKQHIRRRPQNRLPAFYLVPALPKSKVKSRKFHYALKLRNYFIIIPIFS